ncbi:hypothetical protein GW17_00016025 [Ensete ventricosum]|nr:hypothetical protein GW17_00016025 [Ensete ventricosum]
MEDEALPRVPTEERGSASSQRRKAMQRLVLQRENEVPPHPRLAYQQKNKAAHHPNEGRRGAPSSERGNASSSRTGSVHTAQDRVPYHTEINSICRYGPV